MAKRLIRIPKEKIADHTDILNQMANIVLDSGSVVFGKILLINSDQLVLENRRLIKLKYSINEINEIIIDVKS